MKDFIITLFNQESDRPTAAEALQHPWIQSHSINSEGHIGDAMDVLKEY